MDALKKKKSTTKGQLTRLCQQMETVVKSKVLDIKNLAKLRAIMTDYHRYRDVFEELTTEILNLADETDSGYAALEKKCLDELDLVNDTVHSYEAEIEEFQQVIAGEKQRESIVASTSTSPNNLFRVDNTFTPKLEEIKVPKFNGEILNFPNFKGLYENLVHNKGCS